jgi:hypothetical protein
MDAPSSPPTMRGVPRGLIERLRTEFATGAATLAVRQVASDGMTKLLLRLGDGRGVSLRATSILLLEGRDARVANGHQFLEPA